MKNKLFLVIVLIMGSLVFQSKAQTMLYVKLQDGSTQSYPISSLQKVTFSGADIEFNEKDGNCITFGMSSVSLMSFKDNMADIENAYVNEAEASLFVYPNPVSDYMYIKIPDEDNVKILIYDMKGSLIMERHIFTSEPIDVSNLTKGMYLVRVNGKASKFVKL